MTVEALRTPSSTAPSVWFILRRLVRKPRLSHESEYGLRDIESGLRGLHDWLDYVEQHFAFSYGRFWDPSRQIRKQIESDLAMISKGADTQKVVANAEWVGRQMEEEIDRARRDETAESFREGKDRDNRR